MRLYHYLPFGVLLLLSACASTEETLGDLGELDIQIEDDAAILGARDKAMDNYWEFAASSPEKEQKVEAMRRLADLEMERSDERFQRQVEVLDRMTEGEGADIDTLKAVAYRGAIKLYEDALNVARDGSQEPILLYQLSKAYEQAGRRQEALDTMQALLDLRPEAENRDELHFRRAELLFDMRQFKQAEFDYGKVLEVGTQSQYYEKSLSKRGWSAFKQEHYARALDSFVALIDRKLRQADGRIVNDESHLSRGDKELLRDIFRVVILSFKELNGTQGIKAYFEDYGHRDYEVRLYQAMGDFYLAQDRVQDAAASYNAFARDFPMHEQAFEFDLKAVKAYTDAGYSQLMIKAKQEFVRRYRVNGNFWRRHLDQEETVLARLRPLLRSNSEDVARHLHAQAQKSKKPMDYQRAFLWYKQHLKWFAKSPTAKKLNFLYAELLFEAGQFEAAAREFEKTAYQYIRFGKDAEAGYASLLAYTEREKQLTGKERETWSRMAVGSALRFGKTFPDDSRAASVLTKAAENMFALKKYDQAAVAARQILELSTETSPEARRTAWKIIARAEFEKGDYSRAEVAYKVALSLTSAEDPVSRKLLKEGLAAAVYKQGELMQAKGNVQGAIAQFSRVDADSAVAEVAEFDIASSLLSSGEWYAAIEALGNFRDLNPTSKLLAKVSQNLILAYQKTNQPSRAAGELERYVGLVEDPELRREALWRSIELYEKAGDMAKVLAGYERYVDEYPRPLEQAMEVRQTLATIYGDVGNAASKHFWQEEIVRQEKAAGKESTQRMRYLAAKAAFELAQPVLKAYQRVKLVEPLQQSLKRKKEKMQLAVDTFTATANYGVAGVTTASVYILADIYADFGAALMGSQRPAGLSEEELEQYDILLEEQAYPFEEKSITIHESNVERIADGAYDEWVQKSFNRLKELSPFRYAKVEKSEPMIGEIY
ncbi:MAG: tetratricopeptide repeat protein [Gammaproteobacteria bacterium]|nr:tetratricopeptide repeat protein [Gammaproteobacteria bacterium]MCF6364237.1 tetratricopeptide repeat protein [Gammaproteobacteria bacterium]